TDVCLAVVATFTDQSNGNGATINNWEWDFTTDGTVDNNTQGPNTNQYPTQGIYNVELVVTTTDGCKDTLVKTVNIYPMPVAAFTFTDECFGTNIPFTDASTISNTITVNNITQWVWDFDDTNASNLQNPSHLYGVDGQYDVELTITTDHNCSNSIIQTINVWPLPIIGYSPTEVCLNAPTQFTDTSTVTLGNNVGWSWDFGDASPIDNLQHPIHTYGSDGSYPTQLIVTTNYGCKDSLTQTVTVNPLPVVSFGDPYAACAPNVCVNFLNTTGINNPGIISTYQWYFGDGDSSSVYQPSHCYQNSSFTSVNNFDVTLIAKSNKNCYDTLTQTNFVTAYPKPLADFSYNPTPTDIYDAAITFTDLSVNASVWNWDLGDGASSIATNPVHQYADSGTYVVILYMENQYGCLDTAIKNVIIDPVFAIWIPNVFTPNEDGTNDFFMAEGYGILELQTLVFDRWGVLVYEGYQLDSQWNGIYKGDVSVQDVYAYKIKAKDIFGEWHEFIGKVTLVK
ncbi:MAG: PKD domain-containing protein, partial [Flavobacteriales bacterium]|nr:PKD domain-containing protein [Flavobacteriales bacterium]